MNTTGQQHKRLKDHLTGRSFTITVDYDPEYTKYFAASGGPDSEYYESDYTIDGAISKLITRLSTDLGLTR